MAICEALQDAISILLNAFTICNIYQLPMLNSLIAGKIRVKEITGLLSLIHVHESSALLALK